MKNIDIQRLNIFENEKIVLLTVPKIAHSWCINNFLGKGTDINSEFSINQYTFEITDVDYNDNQREDDYFKKINDIWSLILDKKEKRDLVILYRNPMEHFLSAFMQDYSNNFVPNSTNQQPYWEFFIDSLQVPSVIRSQFLSDVTNTGKFDFDIILKYPDISKQIMIVNLDYYLKQGVFETGHYRMWLSFINKLITSDQIDRNKIKFVDIYDAPLEFQLKNVMSFKTKSAYDFSGYTWSFNFLKNIIDNNVRYYETISSFLKYEFLYYNEIKLKYKKNHIFSQYINE